MGGGETWLGRTRGLAVSWHDPVTMGIGAAAVLMFVGTGSAVLPDLVRSWVGPHEPPDILLTNALLLNIALIVFGWQRYRALMTRIAEGEKRAREADALARIDPLTGCVNRRELGYQAEEVWRAAAGSGRSVALLGIDLDDFKQINDRHGHAAGDALLRATSERLRQSLPADGVLARMGGDEFGVLLPHEPGNRTALESLAVALVQAASKPVETDTHQVGTTVSIGIAVEAAPVGNDAQTALARVMERADIAMYHAKKLGKNRFAWFAPIMENELRDRGTLEAAVRDGIANGEFVPYYERQVDLETGELTGFEMLARWRSPRLGMVGPELFIPIAEEAGMVADLSERLIGRAMRDAGEWDPSLSLSVNISPVQLRDPWFANTLLKFMTETGFPAERLEIEITESCLHDDIGAVRTTVLSLKNQGIKVSLDDFGTGFSSLAQLRALPFDRIKIDRSFTGLLADENGDTKLVDAIVALGEGLDLPITVEGISDAEVLKRVRMLGRFKGQGYLYGEPLDAEATVAMLSRDRQAPAADTDVGARAGNG